MTPIERAARAIYAEYENRPVYAQGQMNGILAQELARAALLAIKYEDGTDESTLIDVSNKYRVEAVSLIEAYDAMIDAALSEQ